MYGTVLWSVLGRQDPASFTHASRGVAQGRSMMVAVHETSVSSRAVAIRTMYPPDTVLGRGVHRRSVSPPSQLCNVTRGFLGSISGAGDK